MIHLQSLLDLKTIREGSSIFIPQGVIGGVLSDSVLKEPASLREISLNEREDSESKSHIRVLGLDSVSLQELIHDIVESGLLWESAAEMTEIRVILQPVVQVLDGLSLLELVGARDTKAEEGVKVEGVDLIGTFEGDYGIVVLVVLLVELTH